ncbi:type IV pilus modification PilV family protein [Salinicola acroporae]
MSANLPPFPRVEPHSISLRSPVRLGGRERGVTLIESLIALLVLSIALLGVGALQLMTQRDEVEARWRSAAVAMSGNLIEQLRTDRVASEG